MIIAAVRYRLKITLSHCQKSHITAEDIVSTNAADFSGKGLNGLGRQRTQPVQAQPYDRQSGVRSIEFLFGLRDDELLHAFTSQVSSCEVA